MSVTQLTDQELDAMGNPDKPFRIQSRTHWGFKKQDRVSEGVWRHRKCYRSRSAMERGLAHLQYECAWSNWSGPNYQGEQIRHKVEFRTRELTEFPEVEALTVRDRIKMLERQRYGLSMGFRALRLIALENIQSVRRRYIHQCTEALEDADAILEEMKGE